MSMESAVDDREQELLAVDRYIYSLDPQQAGQQSESQSQELVLSNPQTVMPDDVVSQLPEGFQQTLQELMQSDADPDTKIDILEAAIRLHLELIEPEPVHIFSNGLYCRELTIPAGALIVGAVHKTQHVVVVSAGTITVWSEERGLDTITAPYTYVSEPGARRVAFALEDTVWTTFHPTTETDLDALERQLVEYRERLILALPEECES